MGFFRRFLAVATLIWAIALGDAAHAAFDAASQSNSGNWSTNTANYNWSHTTAGSDRFLAVAVSIYNGAARTVTGITYNGVALTKLHSITASLEGNTQDFEVWYLINPAVGANTIDVTLSASASFTQGMAMSYNGIDQTSPIDSQSIGQSLVAANTFAQPTTVVSSQATLVSFAWPRMTPPTSMTNGLARTFSVAVGAGGDSNGNVSTGSQSVTWNKSGAVSWPGVSAFSILTTAAEPIPLLASKLVSGGVIENISVWSSKLTAAVVITNDNELRASRLTAFAVTTEEINASLTETAAATDGLVVFPAGGGGGGAAGIYGNGEDGGNADFDGNGGYGGAADFFMTARQLTPGAVGNAGTEWNGSIGSGSGGAGGSYNPAGVGQSGGVGGGYGGGGGGGGGGSAGPGLGALGSGGIIWIQYRSTVSGLLVEDTLTTGSGSWTVPVDWNSSDNKLALTGAGGCGADASALAGGNGGYGGHTVGGINITGLTPGAGIAYHVNTAAEACSVTAVQSTFGSWAAGAGGNGGGGGGGGSAAGAAAVSFVYSPGQGGPGGDLLGLEITPNSGGLHPWSPLTTW